MDGTRQIKFVDFITTVYSDCHFDLISSIDVM